MKYTELIEKRKSIREYKNKALSEAQIAQIQAAFDGVKRLIPEIAINLEVRTDGVQDRIEGVAGYQGYCFKAPAYLAILSEQADGYLENAGYAAEDLILKLTEMGLDNCWLTVHDSDASKRALFIESDKEIAALIAVGYGKTERALKRLDIKNPGNVTVRSRDGHVAPKIAQEDLVYAETWGNPVNWDQVDPLLDTAFYSASIAPSFCNLQPYRFVVRGHEILLYVKKEEVTSVEDTRLDLGAVMLNFTMAYAELNSQGRTFTLGEPAKLEPVGNPEEYILAAYFEY